MSFEDADDKRPYYQSVGTAGECAALEWHLVYPSGFLDGSSRDGIVSLKSWLKNNGINPYDRYTFRRHLIEKLNDPRIEVVYPYSKRD